MAPTPLPLPPWPIPKFNLEIKDLDHKGVDVFLAAVNPKEALRVAVLASFEHLYTPENVPTNVKEITLRLMSMPGVAHTFGTSEHNKVIEFSLDYIAHQPPKRQTDEIMGVLVHEVVHCYQYDALHTCPGGLIEGIADFVRLHAKYAPPHWTGKPGKEWDAGYEKTAYFLDWVESVHGAGIIRLLNECLKDCKYSHKVFEDLTGQRVDDLWVDYCAFCERRDAPAGTTSTGCGRSCIVS